MERRKGYKYVTALPGDERFVSMIEHQGVVFVLTDSSMYQMIDECLVKVDIQLVDNDDPTEGLPEFEDILVKSPLFQVNGVTYNTMDGEDIKRVVVVPDKLVNIIT